MAIHTVRTATAQYDCVVERGLLGRVRDFLPAKAGKIFVVTTEDVWRTHGHHFDGQFPFTKLLFPGGEPNKRMASVEALAEAMVEGGGDRSSVVIAFGGGIVGDLAGFLAAIFMRGIPVLQVPTTLLAQVDAAIGGKTGANLVAGKNLIGSFHQPLATLIDPAVLATLPEREYRAGLFEVVKYGVIASPSLFELLEKRSAEVLAQVPEVVDSIIDESVRIKAFVVTKDEKESDLRRILNYGHTLGHALEAETSYSRFLHGEAVAYGMNAAAYLAENLGMISAEIASRLRLVTGLYGPIPSLAGLEGKHLARHVVKDKKTIQGKAHFVLAEEVGKVRVVSNIDSVLVERAAEQALRV